jgi:phosphoesterase RecJ-like protein
MTLSNSLNEKLSDRERSAFDAIREMILQAETIALSGHVDPDGDALGSTLAMAWAVKELNPSADVTPLLANGRSSIGAYAFLDRSSSLIEAASYAGSPDAFISLDTPLPDRLGGSRQVLERASRSAALDHHITMQPFAEVSLLRSSAASTGDIVYDFIEYCGLVPPASAATCLLTAIVTDTGRFQYQNTDAHAFRAAARLVEWGADPSEIASEVFQNNSLAKMHLKAVALERLALDPSGRIAYSYVSLDDLKKMSLRPEDCDSLIDVVRTVGGVDGCVFLRERDANHVRGNLRSKVDWLDVAEVASLFGGGGHRAASGLTYEGTLQDALRDVVGAMSRAACSHPRSSTNGARR